MTPGLTIRQPWADLILLAGKDVENRVWAPPAKVLMRHDKTLLIGSSKTIRWSDLADAHDHVEERIGTVEAREVIADWHRHMQQRPRPDHPRLGALLGKVTLVGWDRSLLFPFAGWAVDGHYHWHLADPVCFEPSPMKGSLGVWWADLPGVA